MKDLDLKKRLILNDNLYKGIIILSLPIFASNLLKSIHNFVDMYFVSPLGDNAIASITITWPIIMISMSLAIGFMIAGGAIMSQALGAKNQERAKKVAGQLLTICIIVGVVFNILLYFLTPWLVTSMIGATGETKDFAIQYVRIRSFELLPVFIFFAFHATRQSSGDTLTPFLFSLGTVIINVFLTWYLVKKLDMGVDGAAYATLISNIIVVPFNLLMLFFNKKADIYVRFKDTKLDPLYVKKIVSLGVPSALSMAFTSLGFLILNKMILSYGEQTVSAFGIGNQINSLILMPAMGIGGIIATFVGQNIGANNPDRARASVRTAMIITISFMSVGGLAMLPFREELASIFLKDPDTLALSVEYMFFLLISLPLMAIFQIFMGTYQGAGYTKYSLLLATLRLWGMRIPLILLFKDALNLEASCIWYAMIISNFGATIIGVILYRLIRFDVQIDIRKEKQAKFEFA